jgi:excisionase family DNA binding protein
MELANESRRSWFWTKEAAAYIGVHYETLYEYMRLRKGRPPFYRLGKDRRARFPKKEFIEWAEGSK